MLLRSVPARGSGSALWAQAHIDTDVELLHVIVWDKDSSDVGVNGSQTGDPDNAGAGIAMRGRSILTHK